MDMFLSGVTSFSLELLLYIVVIFLILYLFLKEDIMSKLLVVTSLIVIFSVNYVGKDDFVISKSYVTGEYSINNTPGLYFDPMSQSSYISKQPFKMCLLYVEHYTQKRKNGYVYHGKNFKETSTCKVFKINTHILSATVKNNKNLSLYGQLYRALDPKNFSGYSNSKRFFTAVHSENFLLYNYFGDVDTLFVEVVD